MAYLYTLFERDVVVADREHRTYRDRFRVMFWREYLNTTYSWVATGGESDASEDQPTFGGDAYGAPDEEQSPKEYIEPTSLDEESLMEAGLDAPLG
jgi:hypothetical protein